MTDRRRRRRAPPDPRTASDARRAETPTLDYPAELPITAALDRLREALTANQVVIVAGETGSGKTTQLPKLCLELGRGIDAMVGHTQPRRLAAHAVARRLAEETGLTLGRGIGVQVRFDDRTAPATRVKLMTDGILLNDIARDPDLRNYDTLIIDEAHERSLNIDFLLGCLKRVLAGRPDLKLIVTSATINTEAFSAFFDDAPVVEVSGRGYPVDVRYREPASAVSMADEIAAAALDLANELDDGDLLVFLPGEREIHDAERAVSAALNRDRRLRGRWETLKVYGRLADREQRRIFEPGRRRRIVLSTNVAETSLTVPRIAGVVDSGLARLSRYSPRSKLQRLAVEPISQASAAQRAGRCGRLGPGVCLRLYSESDFDSRPEFTDPEVLRTNLASVVLTMKAARLGEVDDFPWLDPPDTRLVSDAARVLEEIGAIGVTGRITRLGKRLARLPLDPRLARVLLAADRHRVLTDALIVVAALSGADARVRPLEHAAAADEAHATFADSQSDLSAFVNLWQAWRARAKASSRRETERWMERHFLAPRRMHEWRSLRDQLERVARDIGLRSTSERHEPSRLARAFISGFPSHVAVRTESGYDGARGSTVTLHPGSSLAKKPPPWIVAAEIVHTARTYARHAAAVKPQWIERAVPHLVNRRYDDARWDERGRRVVASETVTLYGLTLAAERTVDLARVDVTAARAVFVRAALVEGRAGFDYPFVEHNAALLESIAESEGRARRTLRITDAALARQFDERIPPTIATVKAFDEWYAKASRDDPRLLCFDESELLAEHAANDDTETPAAVTVGGTALPIDYAFAPGKQHDGATLTVPPELKARITESVRDRAVPKLLEERIHLHLKALPKPLRRQLHPLRQAAQTLKQALLDDHSDGAFAERLAFQLSANFAIAAERIDFGDIDEPPHLKVDVRLDDSLDVAAAPDIALPGPDSRWTFGDLTEVDRTDELRTLALACHEDGTRVAPRWFVTARRARRDHADALYRLAGSRLGQHAKDLARSIRGSRGIRLHLSRRLGEDELVSDATRAWLEAALPLPDSLAVRADDAFEAWLAAGRSDLAGVASSLVETLARIGDGLHAAEHAVAALPPRHERVADDVRGQLDDLIFAGFATAHGMARLSHLPRYLAAIDYRLDKLTGAAARDAEAQRTIERFTRRLERLPQRASGSARADAFRFGIEELRVSLFAQPLGTDGKISAKRLERLWNELTGLKPGARQD